MKFVKYLSVLPLAFAISGVVNAKTFTPPFYNVEIRGGSKLEVSYAFNPHTQTLVCRQEAPGNRITSVEWKYKDVARRVGLPVVLKDDRRFDGHYADPWGSLTITNETGYPSNAYWTIYVSCFYQNM